MGAPQQSQWQLHLQPWQQPRQPQQSLNSSSRSCATSCLWGPPVVSTPIGLTCQNNTTTEPAQPGVCAGMATGCVSLSCSQTAQAGFRRSRSRHGSRSSSSSRRRSRPQQQRPAPAAAAAAAARAAGGDTLPPRSCQHTSAGDARSVQTAAERAGPGRAVCQHAPQQQRRRTGQRQR